jgi:hypothetical protein
MEKKSCCRAARRWRSPSGRTSSSVLVPVPGSDEAGAEARSASSRGLAGAVAVAASEPEAVWPGPRFAGWFCSCGGAGGADAPATVPGRWPGTAPVQTGAASNLSSFVYFLALCFWCIAFLGSAKPCRVLNFPCLPPVQVWTGNAYYDGWRSITTRPRVNCRGATLLTQSTMIPRSFAGLHTKTLHELYPIVRIDTARPKLSSDDAFLRELLLLAASKE